MIAVAGSRPNLWIGAIAIAAVAAVIGLVLLSALRSNAGAADGTYANDCCGTVVLGKGDMVLGGKQTVGYVVEEDETGPLHPSR